MNIHDIAYQTTNFYVSMNYKLVIQFFIHNVSCKSSKRMPFFKWYNKQSFIIKITKLYGFTCQNIISECVWFMNYQ